MARMPAKKVIKTDIDGVPIEDMVVEFADDPIYGENEATFITEQSIITGPIKILNNRSIKTVEPVLGIPVFKQTEDGKIEIISEFISNEEEVEVDDKSLLAVQTNVFPCNYCERSFPLRQLLELHEANHVRDRKFHCDSCDKSFFSKYDLGKHLLIHTGEKPFKCVVCEKGFSRSTLLRRHERVHSDQPKFLCEFCERSFLSKEEWEKHTENHQKKRPFVCDVCAKSFAFKQGLERHEVVHSMDQPFKCEHCGDGFSTQGKLARHLTAHAGDRPYPCRLCDKSYLLSHHLSRHMRSHKEENVAFKCINCDATFTKLDKLMQHTVTHANESYACSLCGATFKSSADVAEHIKLHNEGEQYGCDFCDMMFTSPDQLQDHSVKEHIHDTELYDTDNVSTNESQISEIPSEDIRDIVVEDSKAIDDESTADDSSVKSSRASAASKEFAPKVRSYPKANKSAAQTKVLVASKASPPAKQATQLVVTKTVSALKTQNQVKSNGNTPTTSAKLPTIHDKDAPAKKLTPLRIVETTDKTNVKEKTVDRVINIKKSPPQTSIKKFITTRPATKAATEIIEPKAKPSHPPTTSAKTPSPTVSTTPVGLRRITTIPKTLAKLKEPNTPTLKPVNVSTSDPRALGLKKVVPQVKHVRMAKADIEALQKQGKIQMHNGKMIFKQPVGKGLK